MALKVAPIPDRATLFDIAAKGTYPGTFSFSPESDAVCLMSIIYNIKDIKPEMLHNNRNQVKPRI